MLLILLSWFYIFFTAFNFGILYTKIINIKHSHPIIIEILGLFLYTIFCSIFAFFFRLNFEFYLLTFVLNLVLLFIFKTSFKSFLIALKTSFKGIKLPYKIIYLVLFITILAQSSTQPYLIDNESYYIQTIKWINEFGYVKGLANIHMFLGQNSAWHTLQAGFNFPFLSNIFNDINGFIFVLFGFLAIEKISNYQEDNNIQNLNMGLVLLFALFLMQFVNTPSPDLIIFLMSPYIFYLFITRFNTIDSNAFKIILSLVLFLCLVKVTSALLLILLLVHFAVNFNTLKKYLGRFISLGIVVLILFLAKNAIISGYLLYPITKSSFFNFNWKVPEEIIEFYRLGTYLEGMSNLDVSNLGNWDKFKIWLSLPKLDGLFNKLFTVLLLFFPWFIYKSKYKFGLLAIYFVSILQFILLWNTSPQYRFFFIFVSFLTIQIFTFIFKKENMILLFLSLTVITSAVPVFFSLDLNAFTNNKFVMKLSSFKMKNLIIPEENTKTITQFSEENINGFKFYSPDDDVFFWSTGDGKLPCVNKKQIMFFKDSYNIIPKQRGTSLKDGFKSEKIN